ncbi:K(+) efflux antiporter 5 [Morus notabilis]|uniref:K(+) efflux antiporter 5 n=1 Tax=Morus notabilis TaxID=981085 RepID=W9SQL2_9ROSA|nr:K(+) efflux antiporter 5 [Morus notabilis]
MAKKAGAFGFWFCLFTILIYARISISGRSDKETRERFYGNLFNSSAPESNDGSIAKMFDRVLEKEFSENDQPEGPDESSFNSSVADQQAVLETVAKITHDKSKKNDTQEANGTRSFQLQDVFSLENEDSDDMTTLIDKKDNVFVMSNKKSKFPVLQVDLRLISDLVVVIVSAAIGGILFSCLGQPVIVGYLLAGSLIGPGGLKFISEMVQVETVAQFGVVFLLFALGLEFSLTKLKAVGPVAVLGGLLQIVTFMFLCGITAMLCGAKLSEGVFVGSFLSMSSTAVVVKFLVERNTNNSLHGQVTIGTLILQDCAVGLLFALLPVLGGSSGLFQGMISMGKLMLVLSIYLAAASLLSWSFVPRFLKLMMQLSSQTNELYQLAAVAFCLLSAWCSDKLGLSLELGSFVAGVMISTTDFAQHTLDQVEPIRNLFAALFLSSIGMLIHVHFLWSHVDILLASVILVIVVKTAVGTIVSKAFRYNSRTSFLVGISLAQIGEFAFVLLSRASNLHLVEGKMYLLLIGTTALSLVTTPLLFKVIPAIMNLGALMHWFPPESSNQNEDCIGAIDGTHFMVVPPAHQQTVYRGRKHSCTQNTMAACSFDMLFTYVNTGWEGSAADSRVLTEILRNPDDPFVAPLPPKYYVVDSGYSNTQCFLAPFRGQRCKTGKHTTEKPVLAKPVASPKIPVSSNNSAPAATSAPSKESCSRCRQGFFCSDHGSQAKVINPKPVDPAENNTEAQDFPAPTTKIVDINQPQTCKNKGCGKAFKEKDNHDSACSYHPGPAVFHDRMRGWKCCDIHVTEFDEFMATPPCTKGWHNADAS